MDSTNMQAGMHVLLADGSTGMITEILGLDEIKVRYEECPFGADQVGQEAICSAADVMGFTSGEDAAQLFGDLSQMR